MTERSLAVRSATGVHLYGEVPVHRYEVAMDALTDAVAWLRTWQYRVWEDAYRRLTERDAPDMGTYMASLQGFHRELLPLAEPFFMSDDAQALVDMARQSLPPARLELRDVPTEHGFVWFTEPYPRFSRDGESDLSAFSWVTPSTAEKVVITAYCSDGAAATPFMILPLLFGEMPEEVEGSNLARLAITFWLLSQQRLFTANREQPSRPARRRARTLEIKTVTVVTLRRRDYPETAGTRKVDWSHRWVTRGHWRNQWYPSEQRHKPIWISDFLKGPSDKPFVAKRRAFEFKR